MSSMPEASWHIAAFPKYLCILRTLCQEAWSKDLIYVAALTADVCKACHLNGLHFSSYLNHQFSELMTTIHPNNKSRSGPLPCSCNLINYAQKVLRSQALWTLITEWVELHLVSRGSLLWAYPCCAVAVDVLMYGMLVKGSMRLSAPAKEFQVLVLWQ